MAFVTPLVLGSSVIRGQRVSHAAVCAPTRGPTMGAATQPPGEGAFDRFYPAKGRFLAPKLSFKHYDGMELLDMIQLDYSEVPLDLAEAARLKGTIKTDFLSKETGFDFGGLFFADAEDASATSAVDRYYPAVRRYEVPLLSFDVSNDEKACSLKVEYGTVVPEGEVDDEPVTEAAEEGLPAVVTRSYGDAIRNLAPVIDFGESELSLSVSMQAIHGGPDPSAYPSKFDNCAPEILIKPEMFDGDISAFVSVASPEVQLAGLNAKFDVSADRSFFEQLL